MLYGDVVESFATSAYYDTVVVVVTVVDVDRGGHVSKRLVDTRLSTCNTVSGCLGGVAVE
jgi:hypothetical protein